jgi:hypothetical protein
MEANPVIWHQLRTPHTKYNILCRENDNDVFDTVLNAFGDKSTVVDVFALRLHIPTNPN